MAKVIDITGRLQAQKEQEIIVKIYTKLLAREYPEVRGLK